MLFRSLAAAMTILAAGAGVLATCPSSARADTCPAIAGGGDGLKAVDAATRQRYVARVLDGEIRHARRWHLVWGVGLGVLGAGQVALGVEPDIAFWEIDEAGQKVMYVGAAKSFIGAGSPVFTPLKIPRPRPPDQADPCTALAAAEAALIEAARKERNQVLLGHIGSAVLSVGSILVLGVGYGHWKEAGFSVASGTAVGLVRTWTQPKGAIHALRRYRRGEVARIEAQPRSRRAWAIAPIAGGSWYGLAIAGEL